MRSRATSLIGVLCALSGSACHSRRLPPPPSAPSLAEPLRAMPADLDLVVRLDLRRMRTALGAPAMTALGERGLRGLSGADRATDALLLGALASTDLLWLGLRPARDLGAVDSVWILTGQFSDFDPHRAESVPRFELPVELGGNLRRYDRVQPTARSAPARIYTRGDDLVLSVSEAEIDAVERSLEQQRGAPPLEPRAVGVLSAVARPRFLPRSLFASSELLRRVVEHARRLELSADLTGAGADATLSLEFEEPALAEHVAGALKEMQDALQQGTGRLAKFTTRLKITSAGRYASLALAMDLAELSELVNCREASCAW